MEIFIAIISVLIPLGVLIIPKGMLACQIYKNCYNVDKLSFGVKALLYVPVYNSYLIRKALFGTAPIYKIFIITICTGVVLVPILRFTIPPDSGFQILLTLVSILTLVCWYVSAVIAVWSLSGILDKRNVRFWLVLPPVANYFLANHVSGFFAKNRDVAEGTFVAQ